MKYRAMVLFVVLAVFSVKLQAQDLGSMMGELAEGIKPEAFINSFDKEDWMDEAANLSSDDMASAGKQLSGLVKGLKPSAFSGNDMGMQKDLLSGLADLKDPSKLVDSIKSLVNGLDPSMLTSAFNKESFLSSLSGLL